MSIFRVKLNQGVGRTAQGFLDHSRAYMPGQVSNAQLTVSGVDLRTGPVAVGFTDPDSDGYQFSIQRTIYLPGPNKTNREVRDGDTFQDVNYFKRFCATPVGPLSTTDAILECVEDDGSVWDDSNPGNNTFPKSYSLTVASGSTYGSNVANILQDNGSPATFTIINVVGGGGTAPTFRFNGLTSATLPIAVNTSVTFDKGDLSITKIEVDNSQSGSANITVNIFVAIANLPQS